MIVEVTCAIIEQQGKILAVQRGEEMSLANKWEFPGGKVEEGETYWQCLLREIKEELNIEVDIWEQLPFSDEHYEERTIRLIPFICSIRNGGQIELVEHNDLVWLSPSKLNTLDWAPADIQVIENYLKHISVKVK
jgi:8-oxo-dGTP diphosphatase